MQRDADNLTKEEDIVLERSLRPTSFAEIIGRDLEKKSLSMMIESSIKRNKSLDHILFHGPPGLGKTSFAYVTAMERKVPIHITNGSVLDKPGDLAAILTSLEDNSILFIDEIHRLRMNIEEILYPAMEDSVIDIVIGKGASAKTIRLDLPNFTIVGATTKLSMVSSPLRDRFGMVFRLDYYSIEELSLLVNQKAKLMGIAISNEASLEIASRSRMTARIAIRILKRVRDLAIVNNKKIIDLDVTNQTLRMLDIDENGLDPIDRKIISVLINEFSNKPVGLSTLSAAISEDKDTLENVYEPFLIKMGYLKRTTRGRVATDLANKMYNTNLSF